MMQPQRPAAHNGVAERDERETEEERSLKPKDVFKECEQCPEMVMVPAGRFAMGSPGNEKERYSDEAPQHQVTFDKPFAVGRFAV
jgi:formylglycine-generating enzyme required for sulfatase activity